MSSISLEDISLRYHSDWFFKQFSAEFELGKIHCILGSSGVGKSTLLKLIAGLLPAESGTIQPANIKKQIAWMPQQPSLLPWLNVLNNVLIGSCLRGESDRPIDMAEQYLKQVGLIDAKHLKPRQLSGGMAQRVSLVRTLLQAKPILLMDEPFSAVDAVTRFELQTLTKSLLSNQTVLMVTHDPLEALRLADCVWVLSGKPAKFVDSIKLKPVDQLREMDTELWQQHEHIMQLLSEKADA